MIKKLTLEHLSEYKNIRLELLKVSPENFGSSYSEEVLFSEEMWVNRLTKKNIHAFGKFIEGELIGVVLAVTNPRKKISHVATLNSMYVKEEFRGLGYADELVKHALDYLCNLSIEQVLLSVVSVNKSAMNLYVRNGFVDYGTEEKAIKLNERYYDLVLMKKVLKK